MSNLTRFEDGRNTVIEEMKVLGPDTREALDRYESHEEALQRDVRDLGAAITAARLAIRSMDVHLQLLRDDTKGNVAELERRLAAIDTGAERLGYEFLPVALRVVVPLTLKEGECASCGCQPASHPLPHCRTWVVATPEPLA